VRKEFRTIERLRELTAALSDQYRADRPTYRIKLLTSTNGMKRRNPGSLKFWALVRGESQNSFAGSLPGFGVTRQELGILSISNT
jgi:hypothetical protein